VALLVFAVLLVRSFVKLQQVNLGYDSRNLLAMAVQPGGVPAERVGAWFQQVAERVRALPDVQDAAAAFLRPLAYGGVGTGTTVVLEGQRADVETARRNPVLNYQTVTAGYFRTMGMSPVRGRVFEGSDRASASPVVIVSESTARALWPGEDPIGKRLSISSRPSRNAPFWQTVIGVVADVRYRGIDRTQLDVYEHTPQSELTPSFLIVRTRQSPLPVVAAVRSAVRGEDAAAVISDVTLLEEAVDAAVAPWRLAGSLLGVVSLIVLVLALVGVAGHVALDIAQRSREFAVRMAVGAAPQQIRRAITARSLLRFAVGAALGAAMAAAGSRLLGSMLFEVEPTDAVTWAGVLAAVGLSVMTASHLIARRIARVDPASLLHE
jgi:hypothetical protein